MTKEEETQFIERLAKQFVLVPRDRFFHFVGGAVAIVVVAIGINVGSVMAFLKTTSAAHAEKEILEMKDKVKAHLDALGTDTYVRTDRQYKIWAEKRAFGLFVSDSRAFNGANVVVAKGRAETWELVPAE